MAISAGSDILAADFVNEAGKNSTPATDSGRVAKLESNAKISPVFLAPVIAKQLTVQNSPASTTETTVLSYTIAAGVLASANGMRYKCVIDVNSGGVSATTTLRLKLGSTTLLTLAIPVVTQNGFVELTFFNTSTSAQVASGFHCDQSDFTHATGTGSESTTSSKTLTVTAQLSNASGSYSVYFQTLEVL